MRERNYTFDLLKSIALVCIILAHVNPNGVVFQIRNFDVPLMIMISVWLSINNITNNEFKYCRYIRHRINRLLIPTWIFLTIFFIINIFLGKMPPIKTIISSYLLIGGIGYVWVIRIYIYIAIITPIINNLLMKVKVFGKVFLIIMQYIVYNLLVMIVSNTDGVLNLILNSTVLDFIGYSFIVSIAIILYNFNVKKQLCINVVFGIIFVLLAIKNNFIPTQTFKYPIRMYYLSYALFVSIGLYIIISQLNKNSKLKPNNTIIFISKNSMWIYLWHILYLEMVNNMFINIRLGFILRLIIITLLSIITVYFQKKIISNKMKCFQIL